MRCGDCKHWIASENNKYFLPADFVGECSGMRSKVDFVVAAGWDGGYVSMIETPADFFCGCHETKEAV
jgi:hypothetical protein